MTAPTIKAIETEYAGRRFRSRLEARWAVFFERMGIKWEYEAQGILVGDRPYLPDFTINVVTGTEALVEVKGSADALDLDRMEDVAKAIGDRCLLVMLGIPEPLEPGIHFLHVPDDGRWHPVRVAHAAQGHNLIVAPVFWSGSTLEATLRIRKHPIVKHVHDGHAVAACYSEARRARFEHGDTPRRGRL